MQKYTLTVLINEKVSEGDRNGIFDSLKKHFSALIKEDLWGTRSLAYEIKHANKAFYAHFEFEAEPEVVITLDKSIRLNEDIIRYLIIKVKKVKAKKLARIAKQSVEEGVKKEKVSEVPAEVEIKEEKTEEVKEKKIKTKKV